MDLFVECWGKDDIWRFLLNLILLNLLLYLQNVTLWPSFLERGKSIGIFHKNFILPIFYGWIDRNAQQTNLKVDGLNFDKNVFLYFIGQTIVVILT